MQLVLYNRAKKVRKWLTFDKLGISLPTEASCCTVIEDYFIASLQAAGSLALAEEAIVVDNFSKSYGSRKVVDQLQFTVHKGEIFALLGPNGAGKTTAVETLEGYRTPDQGSVRVLGLDPIREAQALKPHIGVMLQQDGLYPGLTAREVLRLFAGYYRQPQNIDELLERLGLTAAARTRCRRLSGGQKRRLALALALVGKPTLLFLDEPTAAMDPQARLATWEIIRDVKQRGTTVLLTTHLMDEAERLADRVAIIDHGRLLALDTPAQLTGVNNASIVRFVAPPGLDCTKLALTGRPFPAPDRSRGTRIRWQHKHSTRKLLAARQPPPAARF